MLILQQVLIRWAVHKDSPEYKAAEEASRRKQDGEERLSVEVQKCMFWHKRGSFFRRQIDDSCIEFDDLTTEEQELLCQYDSGASAKRLKSVLDRQLDACLSRSRYRGAGVALAITTPDSNCTIVW